MCIVKDKAIAQQVDKRAYAPLLASLELELVHNTLEQRDGEQCIFIILENKPKHRSDRGARSEATDDRILIPIKLKINPNRAYDNKRRTMHHRQVSMKDLSQCTTYSVELGTMKSVRVE